MKDTAKNVRPGEELEWDKLESYLKEHLSDLEGKMEVSQFHGGHANLTYLLKFGERELVLRRPPFGKIAPGAHDMKREYRVLSKLWKFLPQAPRAFHLCLEDEVIGARFVVMERRNGIVIRRDLPESFASLPNIHERLTTSLVNAVADLHTVDVAAADLQELGRPEGFAQRQVEGWYHRWNLSKTEEVSAMDKVHEILSADIPKSQAVGIVHNDLKFDNCQYQPDNPDLVTSIFDWDMTTLGDPLIDFGIVLGYWPDESMPQGILPIEMSDKFPKKDYLIKAYGERSGYDMSNMKWYEAFAFWKNAVVLQQLYKRFHDGATKDKRMAVLGEGAKALATVALKKIS